MSGKVQVFNRCWEFVAGYTYVAVTLSAKDRPFHGSSAFYSFVIERSDDVEADVKREVEKRCKAFYPELIGGVNG